MTHFNDTFCALTKCDSVPNSPLARSEPGVGAVESLIVMFHTPHNPDLCIIRSWEGNCVKIIQFRLWSLSPIQMVTEDAAVSPAVRVMTISQYYPPRWHPTYINYSHTPGTNSSQDWPLINKQLNISNTTKLTLNLNPLSSFAIFRYYCRAISELYCKYCFV